MRLHLLLICTALVSAPAIYAANGEVTRTVGDLAYVTGLNGDAPLWSSLRIGDNAVAEVIKELPELLIVRLTDGAKIRPGDPVVLIARGAPTSERRPRRIVHATRVIPGSHRWDDERAPQTGETVPAEMRKGSVLITVGAT